MACFRADSASPASVTPSSSAGRAKEEGGRFLGGAGGGQPWAASQRSTADRTTQKNKPRAHQAPHPTALWVLREVWPTCGAVGNVSLIEGAHALVNDLQKGVRAGTCCPVSSGAWSLALGGDGVQQRTWQQVATYPPIYPSTHPPTQPPTCSTVMMSRSCPAATSPVLTSGVLLLKRGAERAGGQGQGAGLRKKRAGWGQDA